MSAPIQFSDATLERFAREVAKYPADQKQSAVMACLAIVQQELGYVSAESENFVADYLGMAPIAVHEVTTFYNMYNQQPLGACADSPVLLVNDRQMCSFMTHERLDALVAVLKSQDDSSR